TGNSRCGADIEPNVAGQRQVTISATNDVWGDPCYGNGKRVTGYLYYATGSTGGNGVDSSCDYFCDGAGGGGLYRAPNGDAEAAGYGGSAGSNSAATGLVIQSDYIQTEEDGVINLRYAPIFPPTEIKFLSSNPSSARLQTLEVTVPGKGDLAAEEVLLSGTAFSQDKFTVKSVSKAAGDNQTTFTFNIIQQGSKKVKGNLLAIIRSVRSELQLIDQVGPDATLAIQPNTIGSEVHVYELRTTEPIAKPSASVFTPLGTAKGCRIGYITGSDDLYQISLEGCSTGTFGLQLKANSISDELGNLGPVRDIASELNDKADPQITLDVQDGKLPKQFLSEPLVSVFGELDPATQATLQELGIYAPMAGAPVVNVITDLGAALPQDVIAFQTAKEITVGSSVDLGITVSPEIAQILDAVGFIQTGDVWQFLGRSSFSGNSLSADSFGIAKPGTFKIRIVLVGKDVATTMSLRSGFGKSLPIRAPQALTEPETKLGNQQIDITLNAVVGPDGAPAVVEQLPPPVVDPGAGIL
ncbi:MAG: hypothetical protein EBR26_05695, partial [Microbacteriaceae bacterium]|nr:hypothetical protein [Microbacteriaceae bacterium]